MSSEGRAVKQAKSAVEKNAENVADQVADTSVALKDKVSDNISNIAEKLNQGVDSGKNLINDSAGKVNELAHQALDKAGDLGRKAADAVSNSPEYIKNFDFEETKESIKTAVREKPEIILITVGVLGLAVGYLLGKKNA